MKMFGQTTTTLSRKSTGGFSFSSLFGYRLIVDQVIGDGNRLFWDSPHLKEGNEDVSIMDRHFQAAKCPKTAILFVTSDAVKVKITAHMERRVWKRGSGIFKWLLWFVPAIEETMVWAQFYPETKTGAILQRFGFDSIKIPTCPGETIEEAVMTYCKLMDPRFNMCVVTSD